MRAVKLEIDSMRSIIRDLRFLVGDQPYLAGFIAGVNEAERRLAFDASTPQRGALGSDAAWMLGYADGLAGDIEPLAALVMRAHDQALSGSGSGQ